VNVALLGCGDIAEQYVRGMAQFPERLTLVAVADQDAARAAERGAVWGVRGVAPEELLADAAVELVVNLTPPRAHVETTRAALEAGKHVYSEKPLALTVEEGRGLVELAEALDLGLACAPDTFLGSALETACEAILGGRIGRPLAAQAFVGDRGPEHWHPAPAAYYEPGAGPLFSLGPYYLTALVQLLGPIAEATAFATRPFPERTRPDGTTVPTQVETTYTGALRFVAGPVATLFASYDVEAKRVPNIEVYGSEATLSVPDPNLFDGPILLGRGDAWEELPVRHATGRGRGVGVADLAEAVEEGREPRASGDLALHVLDAMCALDEGGRALG
jgi:predicted dehydrogenase